jgi:diguanylate cyclase (GGDEF)-like protein
MDLDQFKIINDSCGHMAGDALLGQLGALLKSKIRWRDTLARLGGDEFGVLLENCTLDEAIETAEALLKAVQASSSSGRTAASGSGPASAWCRSRRRQ